MHTRILIAHFACKQRASFCISQFAHMEPYFVSHLHTRSFISHFACTELQCGAEQCSAVLCSALHCIELLCIALHCIALHSLHSLQCIALQRSAMVQRWCRRKVWHINPHTHTSINLNLDSIGEKLKPMPMLIDKISCRDPKCVALPACFSNWRK